MLTDVLNPVQPPRQERLLVLSLPRTRNGVPEAWQDPARDVNPLPRNALRAVMLSGSRVTDEGVEETMKRQCGAPMHR
jgi:hypothetical protein